MTRTGDVAAPAGRREATAGTDGRGRVLARRLVPAPLRDPAQRPRLLGWLGVGLVVRLLIAPFTISADLLAVYWRSHLIAYDGTVFGDYLVNMGAHYTHALSLRVLAPLLPPPDQLWTDPWWWSDSAGLAPQIQRAVSDSPDVFTTLLALKLPYLVADLVTGLLLLAMVAAASPRLVRRTWAFWMLSPIGLYATYAFGRYEVLAIVLVVAALLACERDHPWWGAVLLGIAVTMRGYPILLVPIGALIAVRGVWRQAGWAAVALVPLAVTLVTNRLWGGGVGEFARLRDFDTGSTFLAYTIEVDGPGPIYVFGLFAVAIVVVLAGRQWGWWGPGPVAVADLWVWWLVFHVGMFALGTFSAHYFAWFTPFVALALARRPAWRGLLPLHLAQVVVVLALADLLGGPGTTWGLWQPLQPDVVDALPNLRELLLGDQTLAEQAAGALRTTFIALTAVLAWPALRELARGSPDPPT